MILRRIANFTRSVILLFRQTVFPTKQAKRVTPWFRDNGDKTHRLDYELNPDSLVIDLGGYEGQWASDIYSRYKCRIFVFEPYIPYAENIRMRFKHNNDISVFDVGLSAATKEVLLAVANDSSSIHKDSEGITSSIKLEEALSFFLRHKISEVDLMKINIEGGEYDLLEHLIDSNLIIGIKNIQVQFHDFVPDAYARMKTIQSRLAQTHEATYSYEFVWENWALKKASY